MKSHSDLRIEIDSYWKNQYDRRFIIYVEAEIGGKLYSFDRVFHHKKNLITFKKKLEKMFNKGIKAFEKFIKEE